MKYFKKLDFVSEEIGFEVDESRIYKSYTGACLSFIVTILVIVLGIIIGNEVYERKTPNVSISSNYLSNSKISLKEYPVFFTVCDTNGEYYNDYTQYLNLYTYKMNLTNNEAQFYGTIDSSIHRCTMDDFYAYIGKVHDADLKAYLEIPTYCITFDDNFEILNPYVSANSSLIDFRFQYCEGDHCAEDLNFALKEIYVNFVFMNAYVDSDEYKNPIKYYLYSFSLRLSYGFLKTKIINFVNSEFISDNGWLFENFAKFKYISLKDTFDEVNSSSSSYPKDMYWITLVSPNIREIGKRTYMKVQDLFANIGGMINAIIIIVNIIFYDYLRFILKKDIAHYLISNKNSCSSSNIFNNSNMKGFCKGTNINNKTSNNNIFLSSMKQISTYKRNIDDLSFKENNQVKRDSNINISVFNNNNNNNNINNINNNNKNIPNKDEIISPNIDQNDYNINNISSNPINPINNVGYKRRNSNNIDVYLGIENENKPSKNELETYKRNLEDIKSSIGIQIINLKKAKSDDKDNAHIKEINCKKYSNLMKQEENELIKSLFKFRYTSKEELLVLLRKTSYLKYLANRVCYSHNNQNEFIRLILSIVKEKIDFFKNIKIITED